MMILSNYRDTNFSKKLPHSISTPIFLNFAGGLHTMQPLPLYMTRPWAPTPLKFFIFLCHSNSKAEAAVKMAKTHAKRKIHDHIDIHLLVLAWHNLSTEWVPHSLTQKIKDWTYIEHEHVYQW